jgi:hypothetical protein
MFQLRRDDWQPPLTGRSESVSVSDIPVEDIKQWRGQDVIDPGAKKLGRLVEILYDTQTDTPAFAVVRSGHMGGRHDTLVPLNGALVGQDYLRVSVEKGAFKDAPSFDPESELSAEDEARAYDYYGVAYPRNDLTGRLLAKH